MVADRNFGDNKRMKRENHRPVVLLIGGFDGSSGAGISADLRTVDRLGGYGVAVVTALTVQDHQRFDRSSAVDAQLVARQVGWLLQGYRVRSVKIGMLACADVVSAVADALEPFLPLPMVIDPLLRSTSGGELLDEEGRGVLLERIIPRATLITPNLEEASLLTGAAAAPMEELALSLKERFGVACLVKGGHAATSKARDVLVEREGRVSWFEGPRVLEVNGHGTGCRLASAVAVSLAQGLDLQAAVSRAKRFQNELFRKPLFLEGIGPVLA